MKNLFWESVSEFHLRPNQYVPPRILFSPANFIKSRRNIRRRDFVYTCAAAHSAA